VKRISPDSWPTLTAASPGAGAERLNSRIQTIRVSGRGYRNRADLKTAIYFHLGGLDLIPTNPLTSRKSL
jgi:hypothetical protein